jgi:hypothetical protein
MLGITVLAAAPVVQGTQVMQVMQEHTVAAVAAAAVPVEDTVLDGTASLVVL